MSETAKAAEVRRILDRYILEVVERYELCPWAMPARHAGEVDVAVLFGTPTEHVWIVAAAALLSRPVTRVAMVIAPELDITPASFRTLRDRVASALPAAGVADFHPAAALDLSTPARLVPFTRRSPDPMLQLVPLAVLDFVRGASAVPTRAVQARALAGGSIPAARDVTARIGQANHATVSRARDAILAVLDDIAADRARSYAAMNIGSAMLQR